jgi:hypothetical protein
MVETNFIAVIGVEGRVSVRVKVIERNPGAKAGPSAIVMLGVKVIIGL